MKLKGGLNDTMRKRRSRMDQSNRHRKRVATHAAREHGRSESTRIAGERERLQRELAYLKLEEHFENLPLLAYKIAIDSTILNCNKHALRPWVTQRKMS